MLPQSPINYYSPQLNENCESLTANNVPKEMKVFKDLQRYPKISKNIKDIQSTPETPKDIQ